jgi:hypothetical protein
MAGFRERRIAVTSRANTDFDFAFLTTPELRRKGFVWAVNTQQPENFVFYYCVQQFRAKPTARKACYIYETFIESESPLCVNLPAGLVFPSRNCFRPAADLFDACQDEIVQVTKVNCSIGGKGDIRRMVFNPDQPAPMIKLTGLLKTVLKETTHFTAAGFDLVDMGVWE